ncbi:hypothetical protein [Amycolatopsis sp.]|nr:hypothetical protein [Amycolatopsis sp.]
MSERASRDQPAMKASAGVGGRVPRGFHATWVRADQLRNVRG